MNYSEFRALLHKRMTLPKEKPILRTIQSFTLAERVTFYFFVTIFISSGSYLLWQVSEAYMVEIPSKGGTLVEGMVGNPRFINPVLALSEADKNLTAIIYSGLMRMTPEGEVVPDLASSLEISEDLLTYTARIKPEARWHDGEKVKAEDVVFTIQKIADPLLKSPRRGNWEGVVVEALDENTVTFKLKKAYAPFLYNLTTGILPKHIWKNVTADEFSFSQFNTLAIGSGPYRIEEVKRNDGGIPDYYHLKAFDEKTYIESLIFRFYSSEEALLEARENGNIDSIAGLSPEHVSSLSTGDEKIVHSPLSRIFAVFFNQSHSKALLDKSVREALNLSAPRERIVQNVLGGYARAIDGPLPAGAYSWSSFETPDGYNQDLEKAREILKKAGWKPNPETGVLEKTSGKDTIVLSFSLSTSDAPELKKVGEELVASWSELGAKVNLLVFETGELNQSVIRPRNYDALLFGEMVGRDTDLYPFWHSSQRNDPGLNIALYANSKADKLLEEARSAKDPDATEKSYKALHDEISKDVPAIFLYTPSFLYVLPEKVEAVKIGSLLSSPDRFAGIRNWYIETDRVWEIFLE